MRKLLKLSRLFSYKTVLKLGHVYCGKQHESMQFTDVKDGIEWRKVSLLFVSRLFQAEGKKIIHNVCLGVDMGVYSWSVSLPSKQLDSFLNKAQEHTHIFAAMIRRLEHWNKAVK